MNSIAPAEYITHFDSGNIPSVSSDWTLTAPNASVWDPSITTSGVISFTDGATVGADTVTVLGIDGTKWDPTISNGGVITLTTGSTIGSSDVIASIVDSNSISWFLYVDDSNQVQVTTAAVLPGLLRYPALVFTYAPAASTDVMYLHSTRLNVTIKRKTS